jgi:lambda family phage minor tail protein L
MSESAYKAEVQKLGLGAEVILYEVDMTDQGGPVERFTPMVKDDVAEGAVSFGGVLYVPFPIYAEGFEWSSQNSPAQPTVSIANLNHALTGYVLQFDSLIGAKFSRIRTFEKFLDTGTTPDGQAHQPIDVFRFERKITHNDSLITWELASWIDQQGVMLPRRMVIRDYCDLRYRVFKNGSFSYQKATCPYVGSKFFNANNQSVTTAAQDVCAHTLKACRKRFPTGPVPFGGFPGVSKYRV